MDRMSLPTSGTLLPAAGGMIHAMHGGGGDVVMQTAGTLLPAAGGMIHAMHGGNGGFVKTDSGKTMLPPVNGPSHPIHARSGGFQKGGKRITHLGESYTLQNPPAERAGATKPYETDTPEYKILHSIGLENLYKLDRADIKGTKQEYDVLKSIYDGKCNINSTLGLLVGCEPIRRVIHTLALELKTSLAFSMNIFNDADRAAANAARALQNGAKDSLAKALNEQEESSEAKQLLREENADRAALQAASEDEALQAAREDEAARIARAKASEILAAEASRNQKQEDPLSDEDYARITIASTIAHSNISEESSSNGKPDEDKPQDPFQTASIAAIAAVHDPSSLPVPVATGEEEKSPALTEEDEARIAIVALMALKQPPKYKKVKPEKPEEPQIDPAKDPNGYIAQLKIQEAEANINIGKAIAKFESLELSLNDAEQLAKSSIAPPSVEVETNTLSEVERLEHANKTQRHISLQSIASSLRIMLKNEEDHIMQLEEDIRAKEAKRTDAENTIQFDKNTVKQKLQEWMDRERVKIVDNIVDARQKVDQTEIELDIAESKASLDVIQNNKKLYEQYKEKAWWKWFADYKIKKELVKNYHSRGPEVHEKYSQYYVDKYKADANLAMAESIPNQLELIRALWSLPEFTINIPPYQPDPSADAIRKARVMMVSTVQSVRQNPVSFDEKRATDIVAALQVVSQVEEQMAEREAEQQVEEQQVEEQQVAEQQVAEQQVAEQQVAEQQGAEQQGAEQQGDLFSEMDQAQIAMTTMIALNTDVPEQVHAPVQSLGSDGVDQSLGSDGVDQSLRSDGVDQSLRSDGVVHAIPRSRGIIMPKISYIERIGEIGNIIDESDVSTYEPAAYKLLTTIPLPGNPYLMNQNAAKRLLFDRDDINPYYSTFRSKNSVCARTYMAIINTVKNNMYPDSQFILDFNRSRNWTIHFPTDMLSEEEKNKFAHIPDFDFDFHWEIYEKWIQPVLKYKLTPDERAIFICFHQGLYDASPFGNEDELKYTFSNNSKHIILDKHTLILDENIFSFQYISLLYKIDDAKRREAINISGEDRHMPEKVLFSGTVHIDRKNYKKANDTSFIQFELFDFHHPFLDVLPIQQLKSIILTVKKYLRYQFYPNIDRSYINNSSPFKNENASNNKEYQLKRILYHKYLLEWLVLFIQRNQINYENLNINQKIRIIEKMLQNPSVENPFDYNSLSSVLNDIEDALTSRLESIHRDFEQMIVRAHSLATNKWNVVIDNVFFNTGPPRNEYDIVLEPENSLFKTMVQYKLETSVLSEKLEFVFGEYDEVRSMDTLKQIIEKIKTFESADRYPVFGQLAEWYDKRSISKNYESRKSFHEKLSEISIKLFNTDRSFLDASMSFAELMELYHILINERHFNVYSSNKSNDESNNESPPPSPSISPPPSPKSSSSQTLLNMGSLLEKLEALPHDPSNADLQPVAKAVEEIVVELDEDAAELARLEEELRKAEAELERMKAASKAAREKANEARKRANVALEQGQSDAPEQSSPAAAVIDLLSDESPAVEPSLKISSESRPVAANAVVNLNANRSANRAAAIAKLEAELAAQRAARKADGVKVVNGSVRNKAKEFNKMGGILGKHPKFLESKALNNALAGVQTQATATETSTQATSTQSTSTQATSTQSTAPQEEPEVQSTQSNAIPKVQPSGINSFNEQYQNALRNAKQEQSKQAEINALIQSEMDHQGITTPRSISEEPRPATASVSENTSASTNIPSSANVIPIQTVPNKPKLPGLEHYTEQAGITPHVASEPHVAPESSSPQISSFDPKVLETLKRKQNEYYKELEEDPALRRYREKQALFAAENAARKEKERKKALERRNAVLKEEDAKASQKAPPTKITNQRLPPISQTGSLFSSNPKSELEPIQRAPSNSSQKMPKGMANFMKREKQKQNKITQAKTKRLDQIKLKVAMGQPLTSNEKAIYRSIRGGTRKKTKQSRKKLQTRKRSTKRSSKRSTSKQ